MDFLRRLLSGDVGRSKDVAKRRLQLVLVNDRAALAPHIMEELKNELIQVISKYIDVDTDNIEVNLNNEDDSVALVANIPVRQLKR